MTFTYKTRCEGGMNPKLMACAGIHSFHPVATVGKSFSCITRYGVGKVLLEMRYIADLSPGPSQLPNIEVTCGPYLDV